MPRPPRPKATKAIVLQRTDEILRIRLDGAEFWDVCDYVREKEQEAGSPWKLADGEIPMSDGQIWRYIGKADAIAEQSSRASRKTMLRRHISKRRNLYAKSVNAGDVSTALAVLRDEAALLGLYPEKTLKHKHGGDANNTTPIGFIAMPGVVADDDNAYSDTPLEVGPPVPGNGPEPDAG